MVKRKIQSRKREKKKQSYGKKRDKGGKRIREREEIKQRGKVIKWKSRKGLCLNQRRSDLSYFPWFSLSIA